VEGEPRRQNDSIKVGSLGAPVQGVQTENDEELDQDSERQDEAEAEEKEKTETAALIPLTDGAAKAEEPKAETPAQLDGEAKAKPGKADKEDKKQWQWQKDAPVRVTAPDATRLWHNTEGVVVKQVTADSVQVMMKKTSSVRQNFRVADLYLLTGKEKLPMKEVVDLRKVTNEEKDQALLMSGGQVTYIDKEQKLEHPELATWFLQLQTRSRQSGHVLVKGQTVYLDPASGEVAVYEMQGGGVPKEQNLQEWRDHLQLAVNTSDAVFVTVPVYNGEHWTMLQYSRQQDEEQLRTRYYDSLPTPSELCRKKAMIIHSIVHFLLGSKVEPGFPSTVQCPVKQKDGWSCGFHVMNRMEEEWREWRGEGKWRVYRSIEECRKELNKWIECIAKHKLAKSLKKGEEAGLTPPPPVLPPPQLLEEEPPAVPLAATPGGTHGCSKCRWSTGGCHMCNSWKADKYYSKKQGLRVTMETEEKSTGKGDITMETEEKSTDKDDVTMETEEKSTGKGDITMETEEKSTGKEDNTAEVEGKGKGKGSKKCKGNCKGTGIKKGPKGPCID